MNKPGCLQLPTSTKRIQMNILDSFWTETRISLGNIPWIGDAVISRMHTLIFTVYTRFISKVAIPSHNSSSSVSSFPLLHVLANTWYHIIFFFLLLLIWWTKSSILFWFAFLWLLVILAWGFLFLWTAYSYFSAHLFLLVFSSFIANCILLDINE